jgi:hypothetical protein
MNWEGMKRDESDDLIWGAIPAFVWRHWENPRKISGQPVSRTKSEPVTFWTGSCSAKHSLAMFSVVLVNTEWTFRFHERQEVSWPAEWSSACQGRLQVYAFDYGNRQIIRRLDTDHNIYLHAINGHVDQKVKRYAVRLWGTNRKNRLFTDNVTASNTR